MPQRLLKSVYLLLVAATSAALACFVTLNVWRSYARVQIMESVTRQGHLPPIPLTESLYGNLIGDSIPRSVAISAGLFFATLACTLILIFALRRAGESPKILEPLVMLFFGLLFFGMGTIAGLKRYQAFRADSARHAEAATFSYNVSAELIDYIRNNQQTALIFAGFGAVLAIVSTLRAIQQYRHWASGIVSEGRRGTPSRFDHSAI